LGYSFSLVPHSPSGSALLFDLFDAVFCEVLILNVVSGLVLYQRDRISFSNCCFLILIIVSGFIAPPPLFFFSDRTGFPTYKPLTLPSSFPPPMFFVFFCPRGSCLPLLSSGPGKNLNGSLSPLVSSRLSLPRRRCNSMAAMS